MQSTLFEIEPNEPKPRSKPRKLMHVIDAGPCYDGKHDMAQFECNRCGHRSEWAQYKIAEIKRGVPCPVCNRPSHLTGDAAYSGCSHGLKIACDKFLGIDDNHPIVGTKED